MSDKKIPRPEEIQKEFEDFVHQRFGDKVQVISQEISRHKPSQSSSKSKAKAKKINFFDKNFEYKPKDVKEYLDRFIIGQDEAKKAVSIAVCDHYQQIFAFKKNSESSLKDNYAKQNLLVLGPTGVGKTYMIKQIAKLIGVPFVKADATRFSETGYMGANVDDLIKDLVNQAEGDIASAQYGIIYLDEVDKLAGSGNHQGRDVSGRGVQLGLLKLMEDTDVDLRASHDPASQIQAFMEMQQKGKVEKQMINTKNILFIVSGAFNGLEEIISKRLNKNKIGFNNQLQKNHKAEIFSNATTSDFIQFGLEPEFIGRLPIRVSCHDLDSSSLANILKNSEGSILNQYKASFKAYGINLSFEEEAIFEISELAAKEKTGARGLHTICEKILRHFKFELPSSNIYDLVVTKELVKTPLATLENILSNDNFLCEKIVDEFRQFEQFFLKQYDMEIFFTRKAILLVAERIRKSKSKKSVFDECSSIMKSYEHGLKLIEQNTGQRAFKINEKIILNPQNELEKMVKSSYSNPYFLNQKKQDNNNLTESFSQ